MSKIGKINISIPEKVKVVVSGSILNIEGPMGKKSLNIDPNNSSVQSELARVYEDSGEDPLEIFKARFEDNPESYFKFVLFDAIAPQVYDIIEISPTLSLRNGSIAQVFA